MEALSQVFGTSQKVSSLLIVSKSLRQREPVICQYAKRLARDQGFNFSQADIKELCRAMICEIYIPLILLCYYIFTVLADREKKLRRRTLDA